MVRHHVISPVLQLARGGEPGRGGGGGCQAARMEPTRRFKHCSPQEPSKDQVPRLACRNFNSHNAPEVIEQRIEVRRIRQQVLVRDQPPHLAAVIDEAVLHGGRPCRHARPTGTSD